MGIFLTDTNGRVLYQNRSCQKLSGVATEDTGTDQWLQNVHPKDLPGVVVALQNSQRENRDFDHEFRFAGPDGKVCWVHSRATLLRSETGEITGRIGTMQDITERKQGELDLERVNQDLIRASREAGIAEVATGVLHNVKNIINSLNVSASVLAEQLQRSQGPNLAKVTAMLREHSGDLGSFLTEHSKGKLVPGYLEKLAEGLAVERAAMAEELRQLQKNVEHIKEVVTMQQSYARLGCASEIANPVDLMEDALRINTAGLARHGIQVVREYAPGLPNITVEKHKVLQILVNFIHNAKQACQATGRSDGTVVAQVVNGDAFIHFTIRDNGVGIPPENLSRVFDHGFTTKTDGHGFGLHSAALTVRGLGGELRVHSDGLGKGAAFSLQLPPCPPTALPVKG
jgi:PAS domain S-box-containing protein